MVELTTEEFETAKARGEARMRGPRAESAHYDAGRNRVIVRLTTGVELGFAPRDVEGLQHASVDDLRVIEVEAFGLGIHFSRARRRPLRAGAAGRCVGLQAVDGGAARGGGWTHPQRRQDRRRTRERQAWRPAA